PCDADADLSYVTLESVEPMIDAVRWFSIGGSLELPTPAAQAALRTLAEAESFAASRNALVELQRVAHEEALLLPLWQINDYAAYRRRLSLVAAGGAPTSLYQYLNQWRVAAVISAPLP